ncbi:hypothetical protein BJX70DRAFT_369390 [Aspergillus crustosus]
MRKMFLHFTSSLNTKSVPFTLRGVPEIWHLIGPHPVSLLLVSVKKPVFSLSCVHACFLLYIVALTSVRVLESSDIYSGRIHLSRSIEAISSVRRPRGGQSPNGEQLRTTLVLRASSGRVRFPSRSGLVLAEEACQATSVRKTESCDPRCSINCTAISMRSSQV